PRPARHLEVRAESIAPTATAGGGEQQDRNPREPEVGGAARDDRAALLLGRRVLDGRRGLATATLVVFFLVLFALALTLVVFFLVFALFLGRLAAGVDQLDLAAGHHDVLLAVVLDDLDPVLAILVEADVALEQDHGRVEARAVVIHVLVAIDDVLLALD